MLNKIEYTCLMWFGYHIQKLNKSNSKAVAGGDLENEGQSDGEKHSQLCRSMAIFTIYKLHYTFLR